MDLAYLNFQSIVAAGQDPLDYNISGLVFHQTAQGLTLLASSGVNGGISSYLLTSLSSAQLTDTEIFSAGMAYTASGSISLLDMGGETYALLGGSSSSQMDGFEIDAHGNIGSNAALTGVGTTQGGTTVMMALTLATHDMLYMAELNGGGVNAYRLDGQAHYDSAASVADTGNSYAQNVVALCQIVVAGNNLLLAASSSEDGVSSYLVDPITGAMELRGVMGVQNGLGISNPSDMEVVTAYGHSFAIVASAGSNSLSVLKVTGSGNLVTVDHVIDTGGTRFGGVSALETFEVDGQIYVLAGGDDDGISLFTLLSDGKLLHLETLENVNWMDLSNVAEIAAHHIGQEVQVFVTSQTEVGLTQFSFDVSQQGVQILGSRLPETLTATDDNDVVDGGSGNDVLYGNAGDDILIDGAGSDQLYGGAGCDVFVLTADGDFDQIMDFSVGQDRLDLSSYSMLYSLDQLTFTSTGYGAEVIFSDEVIEIHSQNGGALTRLDVFGDSFSGPERPLLIVTQEQFGDDFDNELYGQRGSDTLYGGAGSDILNGGDGLDVLIGGDGDDTLIGGTSVNDLRDMIYGGDGNDTIDGGYGNDELRGDAGDDTISGGFGADTMIGGTGNDILTGSALSDTLFGGDGFDFLNGGFGSDRVNGGAGGDIFYHLGIADHGADWIQDYNAADGDVLMWGGGAATADDFLVQVAETVSAGAVGVEEVFVTHIPTGNLLWALVDGDSQAEINIQIDGQVFDLL